MKPLAYITQEAIDLLALPCQANTPIYLGQSNREHMQTSHPQDYQKYHDYISLILNPPIMSVQIQVINPLNMFANFRLMNTSM